MMGCAGCEARDRTIAALDGELAEWRRQEGEVEIDQAFLERLDRWRGRLRMPAGQCLILMALTSRVGQVVRTRVLLEATRRAPGRLKAADEVDDKLASVYVCKLRQSLREDGLGDIETSWGYGYRVTLETAAKVLARVGEAAE